MSRLMVLMFFVAWAGFTMVLAEVRWFRRPSLVARLHAYLPSPARSTTPARPRGHEAGGSLREVVAPLALDYGSRLSRVLGVTEDTATRLRRIHSPLDVAQFRTRQFGWCAAALGVAGLLVLGISPPAPIALLVLAGGPALAFLLVEQRLASASSEWQRRLRLELPIVAEQLGMLLSAGYSLGGGLNRLARRGHGACGSDLERVCTRIRQGLSDVDALREWARIADVDALDRLVAVLALNRTAGDLGDLISDEARSIRREVHRELIETIERRSQQVWIPVTVATLVPGVLFLAVPFIEAMRLFTAE